MTHGAESSHCFSFWLTFTCLGKDGGDCDLGAGLTVSVLLNIHQPEYYFRTLKINVGLSLFRASSKSDKIAVKKETEFDGAN